MSAPGSSVAGRLVWFAGALCVAIAAAAEPSALRINQIQFVGSHNSYKLPMRPEHARDLRARNPSAALALDYGHAPLAEQLDLGLRKLEFDVFNTPAFAVGHVQQIDMESLCADLVACLEQVLRWSGDHPDHVPIWISFNLKDQTIAGLPDPVPFDRGALRRFDRVLEALLGARLIRPRDVVGLRWPTLTEAAGRFLLILDEGGDKREWYSEDWIGRPMFVNAPRGHPAAAVMIVNDPIGERAAIEALVREGYLVRTRADADTEEARANDTRRRDAAFASGAQAVSTDFYRPHANGYRVHIPGGVRCNPVTARPDCRIGRPGAGN